jgi:hypothetical protein
MELEVFSFSEQRKVLIEKSIGFYIKMLNLKEFDFIIYVVPKQGLRKKFGTLGSISKISADELVIFIDNKLSLPRLLTTLAHEMVHAKQIMSGEFHTVKSRNGKFKRFWFGEQISVKYEKQPWEIEAYLMEQELVHALLEHAYANKKRKAKCKK